LSFKYIIQNPKWKKWVIIAGSINFVLLLLTRIIIMTPLAENVKALRLFSGNRTEASIIKNFTGNTQVVFQDAWTDASRFAFYTQDKNVENLNSGIYRKNQYDILNHDESIEGETVVVLTIDSLQLKNCTKIVTNKSVWYGKKVDNFRSHYNISFDLKEMSIKNDSLKASVTIFNPSDDTLRLGINYNLKSSFRLYSNEARRWVVMEEFPVNNTKILPHGSYDLHIVFNTSKAVLCKKGVFMTLNIGELKPVPSSYKIDLTNGSFTKR
jgi:hypothetical protein